MLKLIPRRAFKDSAAVFVPSGVDRYQHATGVTYTVTAVHLQASNDTRRTTDNTEVTLRGRLFVYPPYSAPALDYEALQESAQAAGGGMTVTVTDKRGRATGPYTVVSVDSFPDDEGNIHHWELSLV